jgi:hypothetical protein
MSAHDYRKIELMRTTGQIPLRFLHTGSANFTLTIQRKPLAATLLPFSLKKTTVKIEKLEGERLHLR